MTMRAVKDRMDKLEAMLYPPVKLRVLWPWEPELEGVPTVYLHWPEELPGCAQNADSPLGLPKAG